MKKIIVLIMFLLSSQCFSASWECIDRVIQCHTWRMKVPQGWIVASDNDASGGEHGYAMTFVPDINHEWKY